VPNYYDILGVEPTASQDSIKGAFRRLVKTYHPDRNPDRHSWAETKFKAVHEAYRTLSDKMRRVAYDKIIFGGPPPDDPRYSKFYAKLQKDVAYRARRVLSDLLNGQGERAVETYEALLTEETGFSMLRYMSVKDYLDTKFLLAEQYENRGDVDMALKYYLEVYKEESGGTRLRYFFEEVCDRIVAIYCRELARKTTPRQAIGFYRKAAKIEMSAAARSQIYRKIAEQYCDIGEDDRARQTMREAFKINPRMKGVARICRQLNIPYPPRQAATKAGTKVGD